MSPGTMSLASTNDSLTIQIIHLSTNTLQSSIFFGTIYTPHLFINEVEWIVSRYLYTPSNKVFIII